MELYGELQASADAEEQVKLMNQILDIAADEFWTMGVAWQAAGYGVKKTNFHNVPASMPASWIYPTPGPPIPSSTSSRKLIGPLPVRDSTRARRANLPAADRSASQLRAPAAGNFRAHR